ncbi:hypothetical protein K1719_010428 [Acacia pycnantha]|nr:hypothetical protein K1719_010428 [Acacia pycnantha]
MESPIMHGNRILKEDNRSASRRLGEEKASISDIVLYLSRPIKNSASKTYCSRVPDGFAFHPVVKTHSFVRYILLVLALAYSDFPDGAFLFSYFALTCLTGAK